MLVIFILAYLVSSSEVTAKYTNLLNVGASQSKLIGAGLITSYIIGFIAVVYTVGSQLKSFIVNR